MSLTDKRFGWTTLIIVMIISWAVGLITGSVLVIGTVLGMGR